MYLDAAVRKLCACGALDHLMLLFCPVNFICGKNLYHSGKLLIIVLNHKVASLSRVTNSTKKKKKSFICLSSSLLLLLLLLAFHWTSTFMWWLTSGRCLMKQLVCLVIDEAHRAMGNYSYCVAVREVYLSFSITSVSQLHLEIPMIKWTYICSSYLHGQNLLFPDSGCAPLW